MKLYTEALTLDNNAVLYSNRSAAHTKAGNYIQALNDAEKTIEMRPDWIKVCIIYNQICSYPLFLVKLIIYKICYKFVRPFLKAMHFYAPTLICLSKHFVTGGKVAASVSHGHFWYIPHISSLLFSVIHAYINLFTISLSVRHANIFLLNSFLYLLMLNKYFKGLVSKRNKSLLLEEI